MAGRARHADGRKQAMQKLDLYLQALQQAGHRITAQRRAICEYLATTDRHPTPYEIYDDISDAETLPPCGDRLAGSPWPTGCYT